MWIQRSSLSDEDRLTISANYSSVGPASLYKKYLFASNQIFYKAISESYLIRLMLLGSVAINDFIVRLTGNEGYFFMQKSPALNNCIDTVLKLLKYLSKEQDDRLLLFMDNAEAMVNAFTEILKEMENTFYLYNNDFKSGEAFDATALAIMLRINIRINGSTYSSVLDNLVYEESDTLNWHDEAIEIHKDKDAVLVSYYPFTNDDTILRTMEKYNRTLECNKVPLKKLCEGSSGISLSEKKTLAIKLIEYFIDQRERCLQLYPFESIALSGTEYALKILPYLQFDPMCIPDIYRPTGANKLSLNDLYIYYLTLVLVQYFFNIPTELLSKLKTHENILKIVSIYSMDFAIAVESYLTLKNTSLVSLHKDIASLDISSESLSFNPLYSTVLGTKAFHVGSLEKHLPNYLPHNLVVYWIVPLLEQLQKLQRRGVYLIELSSANIYVGYDGILHLVPADDNLVISTNDLKDQKRKFESCSRLISLFGKSPEMTFKTHNRGNTVEKLTAYHLGILLAQLYTGKSRAEFLDAFNLCEGESHEYDAKVEQIVKEITKCQQQQHAEQLVNIIKKCLSAKPNNRPSFAEIKAQLTNLK